MTNFNKLNPNQKECMAQFMAEHPNLAKNKFPNSAQGRATSNRLWEELSKRLNADGPPVKDAKMWRKVFADQKYQAKKKLSHNKLSKRQTGGGPYNEIPISATEELIIEAAGLEVAVDGNSTVRTFGNSPAHRSSTENSDSESNSDSGTSSASASALPGPSRSVTTLTPRVTSRCNTPRRVSKSAEKLSLLQQNLSRVSDFQRDLGEKIDRLVQVQERLLQVHERMLTIKEEKHKLHQESHALDLQIKNLELESLAISVNRKRRN
ncbi:uncharacterized protein [Eurosta solidaginis]|uniref:uncharacterized protein n=1 Tax=Eurosta solidaginis TaxID=178769 RepID=UPI003530B1A3